LFNHILLNIIMEFEDSELEIIEGLKDSFESRNEEITNKIMDEFNKQNETELNSNNELAIPEKAFFEILQLFGADLEINQELLDKVKLQNNANNIEELYNIYNKATLGTKASGNVFTIDQTVSGVIFFYEKIIIELCKLAGL